MNSAFQIIAWFSDEYLAFPPYVAAFAEMEFLLSQYRETGVPQNLIVVGETGTGKTTLCKAFIKKYPRFTLPECDVLPILYVCAPAVATVAALAESILQQLGDPGFKLGSISAKTKRIVTLMRGMKVLMLLIDEAQHMHDRGQKFSRYLVGDWLKTLIDDTQVPTVLLGLPRTENLLQINEQLRRRFSRRRNLQLGQDPDTSIETECLQMFISLGTTLPLRISNGQFSWDELGSRIYYACDARIAYVKKLLVGAIRIATERSLEEIDPEVLEDAFTQEVWWEGKGGLNPFNAQFVFRKLNHVNEPFETTAPSAARSTGRR